MLLNAVSVLLYFMAAHSSEEHCEAGMSGAKKYKCTVPGSQPPSTKKNEWFLSVDDKPLGIKKWWFANPPY